jgi:uroporphyrin-III C-methyltransferase
VRGLELLRRADVILYDALANPSLLAEAPASAERLYVGKRSGNHTVPQQEINHLLWEKAQIHAIVVRLKAGDPFIFGRGIEEAEYLRDRGVTVEVIPGVTSATAAATSAGISLTRRGTSSTFAVVTGRQASDATFAPAWDALAQVETVVILMGLGRAAEIADALITGGRSDSTPAALIADATLPTQQVHVTTLGELGRAASDFADNAPVTIVVGEVAGNAIAPTQHLFDHVG